MVLEGLLKIEKGIEIPKKNSRQTVGNYTLLLGVFELILKYNLST